MSREEAQILFDHLRDVAGISPSVRLYVGRVLHIAAAHFTRGGAPLYVSVRPGTLRLSRPVVAFVFAHELGHLLHLAELTDTWHRTGSPRSLRAEVDADTEAAIILRLADLNLPDWRQVAKLLEHDEFYKHRIQNLYDTLEGGAPE